MKRNVFFMFILGLIFDPFQSVHTSSVRIRKTYRPRSRHSGPREARSAIPKILHHIFLDGEAAYWRNATLGDDFTPNFYPRTKEKGDKNATFKHEWRIGCQRLMPDWKVELTSQRLEHKVLQYLFIPASS